MYVVIELLIKIFDNIYRRSPGLRVHNKFRMECNGILLKRRPETVDAPTSKSVTDY